MEGRLQRLQGDLPPEVVRWIRAKQPSAQDVAQHPPGLEAMYFSLRMARDWASLAQVLRQLARRQDPHDWELYQTASFFLEACLADCAVHVPV